MKILTRRVVQSTDITDIAWKLYDSIDRMLLYQNIPKSPVHTFPPGTSHTLYLISTDRLIIAQREAEGRLDKDKTPTTTKVYLSLQRDWCVSNN